jgi:hypothetical protein
MEWLVRLDGDEWSLQDLPKWFSQLDHRVLSLQGKYYLTSSAFGACTRSDAVWELAEQIVERINGATRALKVQFRPVRVGTETIQVQDDGTQRVHARVQIAGAEIWCKAGEVTVLVDGDAPSPQPSEPERLVARWEVEGHESALGRALRIGLLPQQTWGSLYHMYEVIKHDVSGGTGDPKALLPLLPNEPNLDDHLERFRSTANDPDHAGIHARHGKPMRNPTSMPMNWSEAHSLIRRLLIAWLSHRLPCSSL